MKTQGGGALDQASCGLSLPAAPHQALHELATRRGRAVLLVLAAAVVAAGEEQLLLQLRHLVPRLLQLLVQLAPANICPRFRRGTTAAGTNNDVPDPIHLILIRIQQVQGFDDQKLKKFKAENFFYIFFF
jgi:hypothetical protein